ncbi:oligosaccharide flippase family protein [Vibrio alginolyticus]
MKWFLIKNGVLRFFSKSQFLKDSIFVFFLKIISSLIALGLSAYISRKFGSTVAGLYFFISGAVLFFGTFCTVGLQPMVLKNIAVKNNTDGDQYFSQSLLLVVVCCSIVCLFCVLFGKYIGFNHEIFSEYYLYIFFSMAPLSILLLYSNYFQAKRYYLASMLSLTMGYQSVMLLLCFLYEGIEPKQVIFLYALSIVISLVVLTLYLTGLFKPCFGSIKRLEPYQLILCSSFPIFITQIIGQVNAFSGQFILSLYVKPEILAYYAVSIRISVVMSFFVIAINKVVAPKFAQLYSEGKLIELERTVKKANRLLWLVSLPMLILVVIFSKQILSIFGEEFSDSYLVLIIIATGQFIASITGTVIFLLQMTGLQKQLMYNVMITSVVSLFSGVLLVERYGIYGAAVMTFIALASSNLLGCISAYRKLKINPLSIF